MNEKELDIVCGQLEIKVKKLKDPNHSDLPLFLLTRATKALFVLDQLTPIRCSPLEAVHLVNTKFISLGKKTQESSP